MITITSSGVIATRPIRAIIIIFSSARQMMKKMMMYGMSVAMIF